MSLPSPNLDDRKFQDIVDDVKRQIGLRCPEWTDHNVSDPGVTLVELFAWMAEMTLFRLNQVPEKNYLKFLEMLGVTLEPPQPARTDLRFRLSRPIEDADGEEGFEITLRPRQTVAGTVRTDIEESIEFATDAELRMLRPRLLHVIMAPRADLVEGEDELTRGTKEYQSGQGPFAIFNAVPRTGDGLYVGFDNDLSGNVVQLDVDCVQAAATGLNEDYPAQVWEWWNGVTNRWDRLDVPYDDTRGWNRSGYIEVALPSGLVPRVLGGRRAYWIRCRYTTDPADVPPRGPRNVGPDEYQKPPEITAIAAITVGGTAPASQSATRFLEVLGQSDGTPGQVFRLRNAPIMPRRAGEALLVGPARGPEEDEEDWTGRLVRWTEVADFSDSQADDRHFTCDSLTGEIAFGPAIPQPDGSSRPYGATPAKGLQIVFSAYRFGGGTQGNVREGQVRVLKSAIPHISEVTNPRRADGGRDLEDIERAKMRGRSILKMRDRAVTAEDFEYLAARASSSVGRARCIVPAPRHLWSDDVPIPPGVVKLLVVPALSDAVTMPRPSDLRVRERTKRAVERYLDERRLLTTVLEVAEPEYLYVSTDIVLVADPHADAEAVVRAVRSKLTSYLHPLTGGPTGDGWPFRRSFTISDLYAQVGAVAGVAFLIDAKIYVSRVANADEGLLGPEQLVPNTEGLPVAGHELLTTREHRIRARSIYQVGAEESPLLAED
jgi:predicted phage baseplate assembly protein